MKLVVMQTNDDGDRMFMTGIRDKQTYEYPEANIFTDLDEALIFARLLDNGRDVEIIENYGFEDEWQIYVL